MKKSIAEANRDELHAYATKVLGLEVSRIQSRESIATIIQQTSPGLTEIEIPEEHPDQDFSGVEKPALRRADNPRGSKSDPLVKLLIHEGEGDSGKRPVPVSVNGVTILLPRGVEFDCPYRYYLVLNAARETVGQQSVNEQTGLPGDIVYSTRPLYPFNVLAMPSQDEIEAWFEATKDKIAA